MAVSRRAASWKRRRAARASRETSCSWKTDTRTSAEARVRRYFDDEIDEEDSFAIAYESTDYEAGVTFGWRF